MRPCIFWLAMVAAIAGSSASAHAANEPAVTVPATMPSLPPLRRPDRIILLQPGANIHAMALSPDGRQAYVHATLHDMNIGRVVARAWPEAVFAVVALLALRRLVRVMRRPQTAGAQHCRKCDYQLTGLTSDRCPECGTRLTSRNRVRGRSRWRRSLAAAFVLLAAAGGYPLVLRHIGRDIRALNAVQYRSLAAANWAIRTNNARFAAWLEQRDMMLAIDLDTEGAPRVLSTSVPTTNARTVGQMIISPNGKTAIIYPEQPRVNDGMPVIDLGSGRVTRELPLPRELSYGWHPAFSADGGLLYSCMGDRRAGYRLVAWDLASGRETASFALPSPEKKQLTTCVRLFAQGERVAVARIVYGPENAQAPAGFSVGTAHLGVWEPAVGRMSDWRPISPLHYFPCYLAPASVEVVGDRVYAAVKNLSRAEPRTGVWDLASGNQVAETHWPQGLWAHRLHISSSVMVAACTMVVGKDRFAGQCVATAEVRSGRVIELLDTREDGVVGQSRWSTLKLSTDGKRLANIHSTRDMPLPWVSRQQDYIVLFDLPRAGIGAAQSRPAD